MESEQNRGGEVERKKTLMTWGEEWGVWRKEEEKGKGGVLIKESGN